MATTGVVRVARVVRVRRAAARAAVAALLCCAGCNISVTGSDAGADAASQTVGDQCTAIYTELCMQGIGRCGVVDTLDNCVKNLVDTCCTGSVCGQTSKSPASAVDACKQGIDAESCYAISIGNTPAACQGVPQKP